MDHFPSAICNLDMADRMILLAQLRGQGPGALTDPPQRGFRITPRFWIDQAVQRDEQLGIRCCDLLPSTTSTPNPSSQRGETISDFLDALGDGLSGQPTCLPNA